MFFHCIYVTIVIQNKHEMKRELREETRKMRKSLADTLGFVIFETMLYRIRYAVKVREKAIITRQEKKLNNLRRNQKDPENDKTERYLQHTVHNLSSYQLSDFERKALSFGLDQHIPKQPDRTVPF